MCVLKIFCNEHFISLILSDIDISNRSNSILNLLISFKKIRGRDSSSNVEGCGEGSEKVDLSWWNKYIYEDDI